MLGTPFLSEIILHIDFPTKGRKPQNFCKMGGGVTVRGVTVRGVTVRGGGVTVRGVTVRGVTVWGVTVWGGNCPSTISHSNLTHTPSYLITLPLIKLSIINIKNIPYVHHTVSC